MQNQSDLNKNMFVKCEETQPFKKISNVHFLSANAITSGIGEKSFQGGSGKKGNGEDPLSTGCFLAVHWDLVAIAAVSVLAVGRDLWSFNDQQTLWR